MPAFAFPESVRPVVGSICRNGQVLVISAQCTVHRYTGTPHHVLSCESQHTPQWVGHHPTQKKTQKKLKSIHNFSQFFTIFHQPSQFYSGFRVVKTCENLSHFVKICEMHTPREAPFVFFFPPLCALHPVLASSMGQVGVCVASITLPFSPPCFKCCCST